MAKWKVTVQKTVSYCLTEEVIVEAGTREEAKEQAIIDADESDDLFIPDPDAEIVEFETIDAVRYVGEHD